MNLGHQLRKRLYPRKAWEKYLLKKLERTTPISTVPVLRPAPTRLTHYGNNIELRPPKSTEEYIKALRLRAREFEVRAEVNKPIQVVFSVPGEEVCHAPDPDAPEVVCRREMGHVGSHAVWDDQTRNLPSTSKRWTGIL